MVAWNMWKLERENTDINRNITMIKVKTNPTFTLHEHVTLTETLVKRTVKKKSYN